MSKIAGVALVCLMVIVALVVVTRLGPESTAVVIGIICGVGASIPTSAIILLLAQRQPQRQSQGIEDRRPPCPPVIVVTGEPSWQGQAVLGPHRQANSWEQRGLSWEQAMEMGQAYPATREFKVIGGAYVVQEEVEGSQTGLGSYSGASKR